LSIIEQAARRLEELRRSGIDVPTGLRPGPAEVGVRSLPASRGQARPDGDQPDPAEAPHAANRALREVAELPRKVAPSERTSRRVEIDLPRLASMGYLTPETSRSRIADEFRVIKRPLLTKVRNQSGPSGQRANLIMVSSSLPGEGKTFVSVNLAISLAMELDTTVMLVDADVSRPSVLTRLGLPKSTGLLDILTNPSLSLSDVILRTNIDRLSLLPAGAHNARATELLASEAMTRLVEELATRYADRILVFDAPPLLPSTESRVLATHMGQVVVVVEAERTPTSAVEQAFATLESCPEVMPLLNKISRSEVGAYYGYYGPA
jgi:protein-tyrosine kinase